MSIVSDPDRQAIHGVACDGGETVVVRATASPATGTLVVLSVAEPLAGQPGAACCTAGQARRIAAALTAAADGATGPVAFTPFLQHFGWGASVEVDGSTVADPEPDFPGPPLPAVSLRMPPAVAHGHTHAIAVWAGVRALLGAGGDGGHLPAGYADALHAAARAAGDHDALRCPGPQP